MKNTDITVINKIPTHWKVNRLKYFFSFMKGKNSLKYTKEYVLSNKGNFPVYSGETKGGGILGYIDTFEYNSKNVIFVTTVGANAMYNKVIGGKFSLSQNCALLVSKKNKINILYFSYLFESLFDYEKGRISLIMQPSLRWEDLSDIKIVVPPIEEQDLISKSLQSQLKNLESKIEQLKNLIDLLKKKHEVIINKSIIKGIDTSEPMKNSNIEWIGNIPKSWKISKFLSVLEKSDKRNNDNVERKMLSVSQYVGIIEKEYDSEEQIRTKEESTKYFVVEPGNLVVNMMWLQYRGLGVSFIGGIASPDYKVYKINSQIIDPNFLNYLVRSDVYLNEYFKHLRGIRPNSSRIPNHEFMRLSLVIPPINEQTKIANYIEKESSKIFFLINKIQSQIKFFYEYRKSLILDFVTGKFCIVRDENEISRK